MIIDDETGRGSWMIEANDGEDYPAHVVEDMFMKNLAMVIYVVMGDLRLILR